MNSINAKSLLVVIAAASITVHLLERIKQPSPDRHDRGVSHSACAHIGAFNHSGVEPYDPSGLCPGDRGRDDYASRDLPNEGRRP